MRRAAAIIAVVFFCLVGIITFAQTVSYWFTGFQRQPTAAAARDYLFQATNQPAAGDALRWNGTNLYWAP